MDRITVGDKNFRLYIPFEEFSKDIDRVADELQRDFGQSEVPPVMLCTLNGANCSSAAPSLLNWHR